MSLVSHTVSWREREGHAGRARNPVGNHEIRTCSWLCTYSNLGKVRCLLLLQGFDLWAVSGPRALAVSP